MNPKPIYRGWIAIPRPRPEARLRLFCLPYAGSGASVFRTWHASLPETVEVCAIQLPGRENRLGEAPYLDVLPLVSAAADALRPYLAMPFALFGHSMGAIAAFELTRELRRRGGPMPSELLVSGRAAPHVPRRDPPTFDLPDEQFHAELRRLNGGRQEALANPELTRAMLPTIRADFTICDTYACRHEPPLACPITAWGGIDDPDVNAADLDAWQAQTTGAFQRESLPGDHFFLLADDSTFFTTLAHRLDALAGALHDAPGGRPGVCA